MNADNTGESLLLELLASRSMKIVLRLLIKSAATLKLAKEDAPILLLMTRDAARVSRKQTNKGRAAVERLAKQDSCCHLTCYRGGCHHNQTKVVLHLTITRRRAMTQL